MLIEGFITQYIVVVIRRTFFLKISFHYSHVNADRSPTWARISSYFCKIKFVHPHCYGEIKKDSIQTLRLDINMRKVNCVS